MVSFEAKAALHLYLIYTSKNVESLLFADFFTFQPFYFVVSFFEVFGYNGFNLIIIDNLSMIGKDSFIQSR